MTTPKPKTTTEAIEVLHNECTNLWITLKPQVERPVYAVLDVLTRLLGSCRLRSR